MRVKGGTTVGFDGGVCTAARVADATSATGTLQSPVTLSLKPGQLFTVGLVRIANGRANRDADRGGERRDRPLSRRPRWARDRIPQQHGGQLRDHLDPLAISAASGGGRNAAREPQSAGCPLSARSAAHTGRRRPLGLECLVELAQHNARGEALGLHRQCKEGAEC